MKQETVCAIPAELFSVGDSGASASKGVCVVAVVLLPSRPPKYTLVCYNAQQVTFCVARMSWVDAQNTSLRLIVAPSGHTSFTDDTNQRWTLFFAEDAQLTRFLACVGVAFYVLYGAPVTTVFYQDLNLPSSSLQLQAVDRASMSFCGFEMREVNGICTVGKPKEQRGGHDASPPYVFQPKSCATQLNHGCFGFEGSVLGMREDDRRVVVIPPGYTTRVSDAMTAVEAEGAVYVVQLLRVEHVRENEESNAAATIKEGNDTDAPPPAVYAATTDADCSSDARALTLVNASNAVTALAPTLSAATTTTSAVPAFLSPDGIPPEHMSVLRKVELGVNAAVSSARDLHDVTAIFSQEWRRHVERPKPSLLSNKALLEQVQRVVAEEETAQVRLDECDRLLHSLDAQNKTLQQRIDRATIDSQKLLEEKNNASTKAMDARLEKDRQLVRLKDALLLKQQEREDLQRHIKALQRTVDVLNEELRQVQGKHDIHQVEMNSLAERLSAMQETLSEERHRNAALTAKTSSTSENLKKAQMQQRVAEGQLTTARGLAEKERLRYVQIMEEERHHRAQDSELLRQDILHELDARERQYQADRQRIAEQEFTRGLRDGKAEGRQAAETDLVGHQDELRLNLQRAKTEVETTKEELRRAIESAMALRRTLGGKVSEMEEQLTDATRKQAQMQYQLAQWQMRSRTVRDTVGEHWRTLVSYATHPCTREELLAMMKAVRAAEEKSYADDAEGEDGLVRVDLQFQLALWQQSRNKSIEQRSQWILEEMFDMYVKGADYHFEHEWAQPVAAAHEATLESVAQLYVELHGSRKLFDVCVQEGRERYALQQSWWVTIKGIDDWLAAQRTAQEAVKAAEAKERQALWKAYMDGGDSIVQLCSAQLRAQVALLQKEMKDRDVVAAEESKVRNHLPVDARQMWIADCAAALHLMEEEEEAVRAGLEAEAYTASSGITFQFAYAQRSVEEATLHRAKQESMWAKETTARQNLEGEATSQFAMILKEAATALAPLPPPLTSFQEEPPVPPTTAAEAITQNDEAKSEEAHRESPEDAKASDIPAIPSYMLPTDAPATTSATEAALHDADLASPPPFALTDPPRVHREEAPTNAGLDVHNSYNNGGYADPLRDNAVFSDVPPPLPPSDYKEGGKEKEGENESNTKGGVAPPTPPLLPQQASVPRPYTPSKQKPFDALYGDRNTPPPLPSDGEAPTSSSYSEISEDSSSCIHSSSPQQQQRPTTTAAGAEIGDETGAEEGGAHDVDSEPRKAKYMFGGSSSEDTDNDESRDEEEERALSEPRRPSPAPARRGAVGKTKRSSPSSAATAAKAVVKPKLFGSSDDD